MTIIGFEMKKIKKTYLTANHQEHQPVTKMFKPYLHKRKKNTAGLVIVISVEWLS